MNGGHLKWFVCGFVAMGLVGSHASTAEARRYRRGPQLSKAKIKLYWNAMQALYGKGLKIKRSKRKTTIAPKRRGLNQARFNRYVEQVYLPALKRYSYFRNGPGFRFGTKDSYKPRRFNTNARVKLAHILLEPYAKFRLCRNINSMLSNKPNIKVAYQRRAWCAYQAMLEAVAPILEYRGSKVTWKGRRERGNLKTTDVIFRKDGSGNYPIVVTVAGGGKWYTQAGIKILFKLGNEVDSSFAKKLYRKAQKLRKTARKQYQKMLKRVAKRQRKWMRGKKIIFAGKRFYTQFAQKPSRGPFTCRDTYYLAYAPKRARRQGYHLGVEINGVECQAIGMGANNAYRGDLIGLGCGRYMKRGKNKVKVSIHYNIHSFNYKRREWRRNRQGGYTNKNITYTKTRRGKRLYSNTVHCTR